MEREQKLIQAAQFSSPNPETWTNHELLLWLRKLDLASVEITTWEAEFLESFIEHDISRLSVSPKQRACIVRMANKYKTVR